MTVTHYALDFTIQKSPRHVQTCLLLTVDKRVVGITPVCSLVPLDLSLEINILKIRIYFHYCEKAM